MNIVVHKYGGTSVADVARIQNVAKRAVKSTRPNIGIVCVVSALGDTTDELLKLAKAISAKPREREVDMLISTGEQASSALLAMAIQELGREAVSFTGAQVGIVTDDVHTRARIRSIDTKRILSALDKGNIVIVAGFQGKTESGEITTLGRGGSDLTAVALTGALKAEECCIFTDVEGVFTADPRIVANAKKIDKLSYEEMLELASLGAAVMQPRSVELAKHLGVIIRVGSSFVDKPGSVICEEAEDMEKVMVSGVALQEDEAKLTVCDVPDKPGVAAEIFSALANAKVCVDMIVQNVSKAGATDLSFTVAESDLQTAKDVLDEVAKNISAGKVIEDRDVAKLSIVGVGMKSHAGVAYKMFKTLAEAQINIEMISTSQIKISCIVRRFVGRKAVNVLHEAFKLHEK